MEKLKKKKIFIEYVPTLIIDAYCKEYPTSFLFLQRSSLNAGPRTMPGNKIAGPIIYSIHLPIMSDNSSGWHLTCHLNSQCTTRKQPTAGTEFD